MSDSPKNVTNDWNRRGLLKAFGIGALIAPIIGGKAETSATAQLIEVPKVKPVELFQELPKSLDARQVEKVTLLLELRDGTTRRIDPDYTYGFGDTINPGDSLSVEINLYRKDGVSPRSGPQIATFNGTGWLR